MRKFNLSELILRRLQRRQSGRQQLGERSQYPTPWGGVLYVKYAWLTPEAIGK